MDIVGEYFTTSSKFVIKLKTGLLFVIFATVFFKVGAELKAQTIQPNGNKIFVDKIVSGGNESGSSWSNAIPELRDALIWAQTWDADTDGTLQIWVAGATYVPTSDGTNREATFQLVNGVKLYGGFLGNESNLNERDFEENETTLSGDINSTNNESGNSYSVVTGSGTNSTAVLDGFTITQGNATGQTCTDREPCRAGGGIYNNEGSPTIRNIVLDSNKAEVGGGMANVNQSNPFISNSQFMNNQATNSGGGISSVDSSAPQFIDTVIEQNSAVLFGGGLVDMDNSNSTIINSLIRFNSVDNPSSSQPAFGGGVAFTSEGSSTMINTIVSNNFAKTGAGVGITGSGSNYILNATIVNNTASLDGGGIYLTGSADLTSKNSVIWNNTANAGTNTTVASLFNNSSGSASISHSLVANSGGSDSWNLTPAADGGNNIDEDPLFLNIDNFLGTDGLFGTADDGYAFLSKSPLVNAGENEPFESGGIAEDVTTDIRDQSRIYDGNATSDIIDIGAYEMQSEPFATPDENNILYVKQNVSGSLENGISWENAIPELHEAVSWAQSWDSSQDGILQIWVAEGTYLPTDDPTDRMASFHLRNGVEMYGGFFGNERSLSEVDPQTYETILSGDIDGNGDLGGGNSYSVVVGSGINSSAVLDGFTITLGNASENIRFPDEPKSSGGGIFISSGSPQISNSVVKVNRARLQGAGIYMYSSNPSISNLSITQNISSGDGGGIAISNRSAPVINGAIIQGNRAATNGGAGGGVFNEQRSEPKIINSQIQDNISSNGAGISNSVFANAIIINVLLSGNDAQGGAGGAIHNNASDPILINSTLVNNSASFGAGGIYNRMIFDDPSDPVLKNVIIWNNTAGSVGIPIGDPSRAKISYSLIQSSGGSSNWNGSAGTDGGNNLDVDPLFVDPDNGEFFLQTSSPALNVGTNTPFESGEIADGITKDLAGGERIFNDKIVDIGAYELQENVKSEPPVPPSVTVEGNPGWRMMGVPVTGVSVADLAGMNLIQGISGLPFDSFDPNFYLWDHDESSPDYPDYSGSYVTPASGTVELQPGTGFIWYMFGPDANPDVTESNSFPITIELTGDEVASDLSLGTLTADWHLISNPFFEGINFNELIDGSGSQIGVAGQVWDPNEGAEGSYVLTTSSALSNKLSAWQGAFIELTSSTEVVIPQSAKTTGATFLKEQGQPLAGQVEFMLEGDANGEPIVDKAAILYFSDRATADWDGYDVSKLTPFSQSWATVNLVADRDGEAVYKSQHSLPYDFTGSQEIPVDIQLQQASGDFTLSWPVVSNLPQIDLWLEDRQTGKRYDLSRPGEIAFSMQSTDRAKSTAPDSKNRLQLPQPEPVQYKQGGIPRFMILINPEERREEMPSRIKLNQNYPNPFNPTTVISYELPVSSLVRLEVYDMLGRNVATLVNEQVTAGRHIVNFDAGNLSSGIYLYWLQAETHTITKKLTILK